MEQFISDNISVVNKNSIITINLGRSLSENIFDIRFNEEDITEFLYKLYEKYPTTRKVYKPKNITLYKFKNTILKVSEKKNEYYSYKIKISKQVRYNNNKLNLSLITLNNDTENKPAYFKYHLIEHIQQYIYDINNIISIEVNCSINDEENWYSISLIIKKPNDFGKINKILNNILN